MRIFKIISVVFCLSYVLNASGQDQRFIDRVFSDYMVTDSVYFSCGDNYQGDHKDLFFDFYEPVNDTMVNRPLVITVFGGAFLAGNRQWVDMVAFGDSLTHYGYTVASIDYRLGYNPLSQSSIIRAAYRAGQDVNAAIRYFKANYAEYGIDTTQIYLLGNSAGSIASLMSVYMEEDERPDATYGGLVNDDLGCFNCTGDYQSHTTEVNGLIAQWGGLDKLEYIDPFNTTPVCFIHGTDDNSVPYDYGPAYNSGLFPELYGSLYMSMRLDTLDMWHELHLFDDAPHCFYLEGDNMTMIPDSFEICMNIALDFMAQLNPWVDDPVMITQGNQPNTKIFPNPAGHEMFIETDQPLSSYRLIASDGRVILSGILEEKQTKLDMSKYPDGLYILEISSDSGTSRHKIIHH
ncbi:MAG: T9SS type A sorting domain-containing protein [Bacteroidota bacterium]